MIKAVIGFILGALLVCGAYSHFDNKETVSLVNDIKAQQTLIQIQNNMIIDLFNKR